MMGRRLIPSVTEIQTGLLPLKERGHAQLTYNVWAKYIMFRVVHTTPKKSAGPPGARG